LTVNSNPRKGPRRDKIRFLLSEKRRGGGEKRN